MTLVTSALTFYSIHVMGEGQMPLTDLLVDDAQLDEELLTSGLRNYVGIGQGGVLRPLAAWDSLTERGKVIGSILALRAGAVLGKRTSHLTTPSQLSGISGVALGTVKRTLRELVAQRIVVQDASGRYAANVMNLRRSFAEMTRSAGRTT